MAVAFDALATGGSEGSPTGTITDFSSSSFGAGFSLSGFTINPSASATTMIILLSNDQSTDGVWTVTRLTQTATEISGSFFACTTNAQSVRAFEIKNPTSGAGGLSLQNTTYGATTVSGYITAMTFTGSDQVNQSTAWGVGTNTTTSPMSTGASPASIPSGDMACAIFAELTQGLSAGGEGSTGGTGLTDLGVGVNEDGNCACSRISGNNNAITLTYSLGTAQEYAAVAVHVFVPIIPIGPTYNIYQDPPSFAPIQAQRHKGFSGWSPVRWRKPFRGVLQPTPAVGYRRDRGLLVPRSHKRAA